MKRKIQATEPSNMKRKIQVTEPPEGIEKLSTELLIEIFSFLSHQDRLSCALVCERFYSIARYKKFHGTLEIESVSAKKTILKVFKGRIFPFWKFGFGSNVSCLWRKDWQDFWKLVKKHITEIEFSSCDFRTLQTVLPALPRLETLSLLEQHINLPSSSVFQKSGILRSLSELDMCDAETSNDVLIYLVNCCPALELLHVGVNTFKDRSGAEILKTLKSLSGVPKIKYYYFETKHFKEQMSDLNSLSNIEYAGIVIQEALSLNEEPAMFDQLAYFSAVQSHLDFFKVSHISLGLMNKPIVDFLTSMECIETISLCDCSINLNIILSILSRVKGLKSIELDEVDFDGNSKISKYTFVELEELNIYPCKYTWHGLDHGKVLNKIRLDCPNLRKLSIPKINLGFFATFPLLEKLTIYYMYRISLSDIFILRSLERLTHLTIYELRNMANCDWELFVFKKLKFLEIRGGSLNIKVKNLLDLIERNPTIQEVHVGSSAQTSKLTEECLKIAFEPIWSVTKIDRSINNDKPFKLIRKK